jgi:hypothetical protein
MGCRNCQGTGANSLRACVRGLPHCRVYVENVAGKVTGVVSIRDVCAQLLKGLAAAAEPVVDAVAPAAGAGAAGGATASAPASA